MRFILTLMSLVVAAAPLFSAPPEEPKAEVPALTWNDVLPFMTPPDEFTGKLGAYRSVMKFDDGSQVKSPADWPRLRAEILKYWHSVMGGWPALIEKPRVETIEKTHVEDFTRHKVRVETAPGKLQDCWLLVPDGAGPFPAVLVTWYGVDDSAGVKDLGKTAVAFGYELTKRGFVTLSIGGPQSEPKTVQKLSWMAYVAANANTFLRSLPEVDPRRIGVVGHSFGGKWAMFASCLDERFACAVWCDPGIVWNEKDANANYWEKWYLGFDQALAEQRKPGIPSEANPRTGAYQRFLAEGRDMNELHALMAPRPFLVSGGGQDRPGHWVALNHTIALDKFLGFENRVGMTMRNGHTPTPEAKGQMYAFFAHFLKDASR